MNQNLRDLLKRRAPVLTGLARAIYRSQNLWRSRAPYVRKHAPFIADYGFDRVFFDNRGNHPTQHLRLTRRFVTLSRAHVLALGCRTGREIDLWLKAGVPRVTAVDYHADPANWPRIRAAAKDRVTFLAADVRRLPFASASFDLVTSDSLLEHVSRPDESIAEMYRVLRPGGLLFAVFGPLFYTHGGAHFEGAFEHLLMDRLEFEQYIIGRGRQIERDECLFYFKHDMFSYWSVDQYIEAFSGFERLHWCVLLSDAALKYRATHSKEWQRLTARYSEKDLLVFGLAVWLRKPL